MSRDVAGKFTTASGVPHEDDIVQVEGGDEVVQVVGPGVDVIAETRLVGVAVATPVVRDRAVTLSVEKQHLGFPRCPGQRPAVRKDDGVPGAPVAIVDGGPVGGCNRRHRYSLTSIENVLRKSLNLKAQTTQLVNRRSGPEIAP